MSALCWTVDRHELVGKYVRRHAFDFDAASQAFQQHLQTEGVEFSPEDTSPTSMRKLFARLDRMGAAPSSGGSQICQSRRLTSTFLEKNKHVTKGESTSNIPNGTLGADRSGCTMAAQLEPPTSTPYTRDSKAMDAEGSPPPQRHCVSGDPNTGSSQTRETTTPCGTERTEHRPLDSRWSFDTVLEEQSRRELQHETRKERTFQKVISALGGPAVEAVSLPSNVAFAWEARNGKLEELDRNAKKHQQKIKEDRELALQREALKQRHLPGSEDSTGDDPLSTMSDDLSLPPCRDSSTSSAALVRLDLGIDAEMLDKILDELDEEAAVAGGSRETNSELSRVLDILDEAAGDTPTAVALADTQDGRQ